MGKSDLALTPRLRELAEDLCECSVAAAIITLSVMLGVRQVSRSDLDSAEGTSVVKWASLPTWWCRWCDWASFCRV